MNALKIVTLAFVLFFTTNTFATDNPEKKADIRKEISSTLAKSELEEENFIINFLVNSKGEIVVVSTTSQKNDKSVRDLLNYKKVGTNTGMNIHTMYSIPVTIKKK